MKCRVCDSWNLQLALDLGKQPWANNFLTKEQCGKEEYYPLRVVFCIDCKAAQLDHTVPKEVMFGDHTYCSGTTKTLQNHFNGIAAEVSHRMLFTDKTEKKGGWVLDIGSNDGTQLKAFRDYGWNVQGVESSIHQCLEAGKAGIETMHCFFNEEAAKDLLKYRGQFDVINAAGVFFHLEELHSVCEGIKLLLKPDGVFVVQFIYAKTMMENGAFDQIYHEHLLYYTLRTVDVLLRKHNLYLFDAYLSPIHGGSIIGFVENYSNQGWTGRLFDLIEKEKNSGCNALSAWKNFAIRIKAMKDQNLAKLCKWKAEGKTVYGMGAPVKGNTLLNTFGVTSDLISCLTERNPLRKGLYAPGSHIPVVMEDEVPEPDVQYVLAWNFKKEILERNKDSKAEFYFPVET